MILVKMSVEVVSSQILGKSLSEFRQLELRPFYLQLHYLNTLI